MFQLTHKNLIIKNQIMEQKKKKIKQYQENLKQYQENLKQYQENLKQQQENEKIMTNYNTLNFTFALKEKYNSIIRNLAIIYMMKMNVEILLKIILMKMF